MDTMFINQYGHPLLVSTFSLLQTKEKKCSVTMGLPLVYIKTKSVVYRLGTYQSKFQLVLSFSKEVIRKKFQGYLNCQHPNIKIKSEIEENNSILFLDIKIRRVNNSFSTNIYRKVTFSGVFTNFESFIPISCKSNLIFTLLFRAFKLSSNVELFHQEIPNLKDIFKRNGYHCDFIDVCIKRFLSYVFFFFSIRVLFHGH